MLVVSRIAASESPKRQENEKPWHASRDITLHLSSSFSPTINRAPPGEADPTCSSTTGTGRFIAAAMSATDRPNVLVSPAFDLTDRYSGSFCDAHIFVPRLKEAVLLSHSEWRRKGGTGSASVFGDVKRSYNGVDSLDAQALSNTIRFSAVLE